MYTCKGLLLNSLSRFVLRWAFWRIRTTNAFSFFRFFKLSLKYQFPPEFKPLSFSNGSIPRIKLLSKFDRYGMGSVSFQLLSMQVSRVGISSLSSFALRRLYSPSCYSFFRTLWYSCGAVFISTGGGSGNRQRRTISKANLQFKARFLSSAYASLASIVVCFFWKGSYHKGK